MKIATPQAFYNLPDFAPRSKWTFTVIMQRICVSCRRAGHYFTGLADHRFGFAQLSEMDDRMLRDIGLNRADVCRLLGRQRSLSNEYRWLPFENFP
jgi:uncharacterized protein YjiS (DUF1127 family)